MHDQPERDAYDRALRDYTQLLRHRIANPLTAIVAGLSTLRSLDLPAEVREEILDSMAIKAAELEHVALQPLVLGAEERELEPMVARLHRRRGTAGSGNELRATQRQRRAALNEGTFRDVNREIVRVSEGGVDLVEVACECSLLTCADALQVTPEEYRAIHEDGACFVVAAGHVDEAVEHVVARADGWWVVEKTGEAARVSEAIDEQAPEHRFPMAS